MEPANNLPFPVVVVGATLKEYVPSLWILQGVWANRAEVCGEAKDRMAGSLIACQVSCSPNVPISEWKYVPIRAYVSEHTRLPKGSLCPPFIVLW